MDLLVTDVLTVLDTFMLDEVDYVGYSLGARVGWHAARFMPTRIDRAVFGGIPDGDPLTRFRVDEARAFVQSGTPVTDALTGAYLKMAGAIRDNDLEALIALVEGMRDGPQPHAANAPEQRVLFATGSEDRFSRRRGRWPRPPRTRRSSRSPAATTSTRPPPGRSGMPRSSSWACPAPTERGAGHRPGSGSTWARVRKRGGFRDTPTRVARHAAPRLDESADRKLRSREPNVATRPAVPRIRRSRHPSAPRPARTASRPDQLGLTALMMAPCICGATSWVNSTLTSVNPAAASATRYSSSDSAPAMQPA